VYMEILNNREELNVPGDRLSIWLSRKCLPMHINLQSKGV